MTAPNRDELLEEAAGYAVDRDTDRALSIVNDLLSTDPDDIDALLLKGHVLEMRGNSNLAREIYERVIELDPGNVHALIDLADCDQDHGDFEQALERLEEAQARVEAGFYRTDHDGDLNEILIGKYRCFVQLGRQDEAVATEQYAARMLPDSPVWKAQGDKNDRMFEAGL